MYDPKPAPRNSIRHDLARLVPELRGRALRLAGSRPLADDLVQDTIERAIRFEASFTRGTNLRAWVSQILFSVFMTRGRRLKREREAVARLTVDPCAWTQPEPRSEWLELSQPVRRALDAIPPAFRDVVVLIDLHERSHKDTAKRLGIPLGTVMSRLWRGRRMLAEALGGSVGAERLGRPPEEALSIAS